MNAKERTWDDLPWAEHRVTLVYTQRRVWCRTCAIRAERVAFAEGHARITRRLRQVIGLDCQSMPTSHAAVRHRVSWSTARRDAVPDGRSGAVAIIQRFGGAPNLNVHIHALVLDGVFAKDSAGGLCFHRTPRLTREDVGGVVAVVERRVERLLERRGLAGVDEGGGGADQWG